MSIVIYAAILVLSAAALGFLAYKAFKSSLNGVSGKKIITKNLLGFAIVLTVSATLIFTVSAANTAQATDTGSDSAAAVEEAPAEAEEAAASSDNSKGLGLLAAALVTALSGIGGGIAVAASAPAAIAATSEDPKSFGKSLIFVALGESIALYGVVISILILNNL